MTGWREPLPIRAVRANPEVKLPTDAWPMTLAPVAQLVRHGLVPPRPALPPAQPRRAFLSLLQTRRFDSERLFFMDQPEAGLSFTAQLSLVASLASLARQRSTQVVVATHSPVVASLPGATILELDDGGFRERAWHDLTVVDHHRRLLEGPDRYLRHLVD
ncbi:MAG: AAA family ATPase [Actinomycetota bacterium]|nr:AAA family ATPase [Actinomycetota bacterium]